MIADGVYATHPLPQAGTVIVGRSPTNDIFVDHESLSRRHAALHVAPSLAIEDLGSKNGTRVRQETVEPGRRVEITTSDLVEVGAVYLIVQHRIEPLHRRRLWSHDYFEGRLEEECARSLASDAGFAVIHLRVAPEAAAALEEVLAVEVRTIDVVASYVPGRYQVLIGGAAAADATDLITRVSGRLAARSIEAAGGVALYPEDGRDPDSLIASAAERASGVGLARDTTMIAREGEMQALGRLAERIAVGQISVLVEGETGVGKEVMAETIHRLSPRADKPFLRLNCAALSETLLESELFGHERGAFTGATQAKPGLLETAGGGTVFLDEIGELPLPTQVKLLRVLEERKVLRVGGIKVQPIDVRFIAATNRDLEAEVARGTFRQDLYFRLNGISLRIPPLRERIGEIRLLARAFVARAARQGGGTEPELSPEALALLDQYSWPGNIRELRNMMERAVLLCGGPTIKIEHLPVEKMRSMQTLSLPISAVTHAAPPPREPAPAPVPAEPSVQLLDFTRELRARERQRIIDALMASGGNQSEAAKALGMSRRTLLTKLDLHGLPRPRKRP